MPQVVTQLIVDSSGAKQGAAEFEAAMAKAKRAAVDGGEATATSFERAQSKWQQSLAKTDPIIKAQIAMERDLARQRLVNADATRLGIATQDAANAQLEKVRQQHQAYIVTLGKSEEQHSRLSTQAMALQHSMRSSIEQLAMGVPVTQVLTQQMNHLSYAATGEGGLSGAFKEVGSLFGSAVGWAGRFVTSTAGVITGIAGIGAGGLYAASAWQESQREIERALIGIGRRSGATVNDINQVARGSSTALGLSVDQARDAAVEFAKTGNIYKDNIKAATDATYNFSIATGQSATDAAKELAKALADPAAGADALNNKLGFLDGKTRELVITLANQNRVQEAQKILLDGVASSTEKATQTLGPFEKAWAAVGNAASAVKNSVGRALSPNTDQENLAALTARRDQLTSGTGVGLFNQLGNRGEIARLNAEIEKLEASLRKTAAAAADDRFKQFSIETDNAVHALIPQIGQLKQLEKALNDIKRAQSDPNVGSKQGLGQYNDAATRSIEVQQLKLKESVGEADRYNQRVLQISKSWGDVGVSTALQLQQMHNQLPVLQAVTGQQQIQAQYQATINAELDKGKNITDAVALAEAQRKASVAQVNAQVQQQTNSLNDQTALIYAQINGTEAKVAAELAYDNAIKQGADSSRAAALADATYENEKAQRRAQLYKKQEQASQQEDQQRAQANKSVEDKIYGIQKELDLIGVRDEHERASILAAQAYNDALRSGADLLHAQAAEAATLALEEAKVAEARKSASDRKSLAELTSDKSGGLITTESAFGNLFNLRRILGQVGGFSDQEIDWVNHGGGVPQWSASLTAAGYEKFINQQFASRGDLSTTLDRLVNNRGIPGFNDGSLDQSRSDAIGRLLNLLPDEGKSGILRSEIDQLNRQPETIARDELIKSLTDQLKQLEDATKENTDAINAQLDPLFSQGHDYIDKLQIGYFKAARGLDMVASGPSSGDQIPFRAMVNGGERITIAPAGTWGRGQQVANDNSNSNNRTVTQHITQHISIAEAGPVSRLTARQQAQGFIQAAARAAG